MISDQVEQWLHSSWIKDTRLYNIELCQDIFGSWIVSRNWGSRPKRGFGQSNYTLCLDFEAAWFCLKRSSRREESAVTLPFKFRGHSYEAG